jgi:hypothetical protein
LYDQNRNSSYQPQTILPYYTIQGGQIYGPCNNAPGQKIKRLSDFKNADLLGTTLEFDWHGKIHNDVRGWFGHMAWLELAPKDPVFWEWHKNLDLNI